MPELSAIVLVIATILFLPALIIDVIQKRFYWLKRVLILGVVGFALFILALAIGKK